MKNFKGTLSTANDGVDFAILIEKSFIYKWEGRTRLDEIIGVKLDIALQNKRLAQLGVKFDADPIPNVSDEMIEHALIACKPLYVQIPDCVVNFYSTAGNSDINMSATAKTARIITLKNNEN